MRRLTQTFTGLIVGFMAMLLMAGIAQAGSLEPIGPPGPTTQIPPAWSQKIPGADRFELVLDGAAVLDKETGLVWDKSPSTTIRNWASALIHCFERSVGGRKGWRLPGVEELASLVAPTGFPRLPAGHPFTGVQSSFYWSSTTRATTANTTVAWGVHFLNGNVFTDVKSVIDYVWCVRGGLGHDGQ